VFGAQGYDFAADLWSLGIVAFVLLTGKPPFEKETIDENDSSAPGSPDLGQSPQPELLAQKPSREGSSLSGRRQPPSGAAGSTSGSAVGWRQRERRTSIDKTSARKTGDSPAASPVGPRGAFGLLARMRRGWNFPQPVSGEEPVSQDAKALVSGLLTENPAARLSAESALAHAWFVSCASDDEDEERSSHAPRPRSMSSPAVQAGTHGAMDLEALCNLRVLRNLRVPRQTQEPVVPTGAPSLHRRQTMPVDTRGYVLRDYDSSILGGYLVAPSTDRPPACAGMAFLHRDVDVARSAPRVMQRHRSLLPSSDTEDSETEEPNIPCEEVSSGKGPRRAFQLPPDFMPARPPAIQRGGRRPGQS